MSLSLFFYVDSTFVPIKMSDTLNALTNHWRQKPKPENIPHCILGMQPMTEWVLDLSVQVVQTQNIQERASSQPLIHLAHHESKEITWLEIYNHCRLMHVSLALRAGSTKTLMSWNTIFTEELWVFTERNKQLFLQRQTWKSRFTKAQVARQEAV